MLVVMFINVYCVSRSIFPQNSFQDIKKKFVLVTVVFQNNALGSSHMSENIQKKAKQAVTGCVLIFAFASLVVIPTGITSSAVGIKICAITAGIKKYKSIILSPL